MVPSMFRGTKVLSALLGAAALAAGDSHERTFVDGMGKTFATDAERPTLVTYAHTAVSMKHYGLDGGQLLGTYGEWYNTGSDFDFDNPELGSTFSADPTSEERELLESVVNLSPGCGAEHCVEFDIDKFLELDPDYLVVSGYRQNPWAIGSIMANITESYPEDRIIYMELSLHNDGKNCTEEKHVDCHGKSMIELIDDLMDLSEFLHLEPPEALDGDMKDLCAAATSFAEATRGAQERGLRAMAAYLSTGTSYFAHSTDDNVLRMFEELGMPIIHPGSCPDKDACTFEYFWEWIPIGEYFHNCTDEQKENLEFEACNADPLYPVDFWLMDHRTAQIVATDDFKMAFPDQAVKSGSMALWPIGGRKITPKHAAQILNDVGEKLAAADRIYEGTDCTPADVASVEHRTAGLEGGQYACWHEEMSQSKYFRNCHRDEPAEVEAPVEAPAVEEPPTKEAADEPAESPPEDAATSASEDAAEPAPEEPATSAAPEEPATSASEDAAEPAEESAAPEVGALDAADGAAARNVLLSSTAAIALPLLLL